jgi:hypothetical protein
MRRKECQSCGHKFYTAQHPEFTLQPSQIVWVPSEGKSSRKNVAQLRWLPGSGAASLKKQALAALKSAEGADYPVPITALMAEQHELIRRALEQLP